MSANETSKSLAFAAIAWLAVTATAQAQSYCQGDDIASRLPDVCQREAVVAVGSQAAGERAAQAAAMRAWRHQVTVQFGAAFAAPEQAACDTVHCERGSYVQLRRCTFTAYPCRVRPSAEPAPANPALDRDDVREMQKLLNRAGARPRLKSDGIFGPFTVVALEEWQARNDLPLDGEPIMKNLEDLRRLVR